MIGYSPNVIKHNLFYTQDKVGIRRNNGTADVQEDSGRREADFSQSIEITARPRLNSLESTTSSFHQSVQVVPSSGGKYEIYPGAHDASQSITSTFASKSQGISREYQLNISNPDLWRNRLNSDTDWRIRKETLYKSGQYKPVTKGDRIRKTNKSDGNCNCSQYHCHTFDPPKLPKLTMKSGSFTESVPKKSPEIRAGNANQLTIYNIFWCAKLAFSDYKHQRVMKPVCFQSLWPKDSVIKDLISCGVEDTGLRSAFWELCVLSILSGPLSVLKALVDLSYIRK